MSDELKALRERAPGSPLVFETEHYRLRSLTAADATETYISWWNDDYNMATLDLR